MKRRAIIVGVCFLLLFFVVNLHGAVKNPDTFVLADYRTVQTIDPAAAYDVAGSMRLWNFYETLIFFDGSSTEKFIPVLATEVGGLPEVVIHGETGFLFPLGDHSSAVRLAVNLLSDQTMLRTMQVAAAQHASQYGVEKVVPLYEDFYRQLLYRKSQRTLPITAVKAHQAVV